MKVDLLFSKNNSVNDFITDSIASVQYSSVDDVIHNKANRMGCFISKTR